MTNIALLNHFDDPEIFSYNGNSKIDSGGKFGSRCAVFPDSDSSVSVSNNSGLFNISPDSNCELEFFFKPDNKPGFVSEAQELELYNLGFRWLNGHSFLFINSPCSWNEAIVFAQQLGGHLAACENKDKHDLLNSLLAGAAAFAGISAAWIGGSFDPDNNSISWINNASSDYSPWLNDAPNVSGSCLCLYNPANSAPFYFSNNDGSPNLPFFIEWDEDNRCNRAFYNYYRAKNSTLFFRGHSYALLNFDFTYLEALNCCSQNIFSLASITSETQHNFIKGLLRINQLVLPGTWVVWLGAQKINGNWSWNSGDTWNYAPWTDDPESGPDVDGRDFCVLISPNSFNYFSSSGPDLKNFVKAYSLIEWDFDTRNLEDNHSILKFGDNFSLSYTALGSLRLLSTKYNFDASSDSFLNDSWNHILVRFSNSVISVFLNGRLAVSVNVDELNLSPQNISIGGFVGALDEFVFRNEITSESAAPVIVPVLPYSIDDSSPVPVSNDAPVTRVKWSCDNLPEGLTLSESGLLSGQPAQKGTFECNIRVSTNWGNSNKILRIVIQ